MLAFEGTTERIATSRGPQEGPLSGGSKVDEIRPTRRLTESDSPVSHSPLSESGRDFRETRRPVPRGPVNRRLRAWLPTRSERPTPPLQAPRPPTPNRKRPP